MEAWKTQKLSAMKKEVEELHPLLRQIFTADPSIATCQYTHGVHEMGADFVLSRIDQTLGTETYIGVIVKCGDVKQDQRDVIRQIEECSVERYFGGKRRIHLNEIWITFNGTISHGAERKIFEEHRSKNFKFLNIDILCKLTEKFAPNYWTDISANTGTYLAETLSEIIRAESFSQISSPNNAINIEQELVQMQRRGKEKKVFSYKKAPRVALKTAVLSNRVVLIEGGMGSGKSTQFRKYAKRLCDIQTFSEERVVPKILHARSLLGDTEVKLKSEISKIRELAKNSNPNEFLFFIDGLDEINDDSIRISTFLQAIQDVVASTPDVRVVVGSRPTWTIEEGEELHRMATRFRIQPLSTEQIINVVQRNCNALTISTRFQGDLARSNLFKSIPRTPLSAILLTRVISADAKEIPQTLPELYSKYVELALGRWDISKGLMIEREYPIIRELLSLVAKYILDNQIEEISEQDVLGIFSEYVEHREGLPDATYLYKKICSRSEIVAVNSSKGTFSFRHKSFAEYLLALHQKEHYGKAAPLTNPFHGYWLGVEYFYLGLIQDAGPRINKLSKLQLDSERHKLLRMLHFGNLMLAAYQTKYQHIDAAVYDLFSEMTQYFTCVKSGQISSILHELPELQFLATVCYSLKQSFEYDYFLPALLNAQTQVQCDTSMDDEQKYLCSFLIDAVRAGLGEKDVFQFFNQEKLQNIPWAVKLGIEHIVSDEDLNLDHLNRLIKKIAKSKRDNKSLNMYIHNLYSKPMIEDGHTPTVSK
jgi:hypothetical protein